MIRAFGPLLRPGGRLVVTASAYGTLAGLLAHLHARFDTKTMSLDDLDKTMLDYADAVRSGADTGHGWPEWINIPSKIGQVAAVRIYARERREQATGDAGRNGEKERGTKFCRHHCDGQRPPLSRSGSCHRSGK